MESDKLDVLEQRLGRLHVRQRLSVEKDREARLFRQKLNFFHIENSALAIEYTLKMTGLFWRGRRNAEQVEVRHNRCEGQRATGRVRWFLDPSAQRSAL